MFHCLILYYFNVSLFDNAILSAALVPVTLVVVAQFNAAVF